MKFKVWIEDDCGEDEAEIVEASCAEYAATDFVQDYDSGHDYRIVGGGECVVNVRDEAGELTLWTVTGEPMPFYRAAAIAQEQQP